MEAVHRSVLSKGKEGKGLQPSPKRAFPNSHHEVREGKGCFGT